MTIEAPVAPTEGRLGHLTADETVKLQLMWQHLYEIFDGSRGIDMTIPSSFKGQARDDEPKSPTASEGGWFRRAKADPTAVAVQSPFTPESLKLCFWKLTMMDHPDMILLKFLRARKWVVDDGLKMFMNALKWRIVERLDELLELSDVELDAKYPKFIQQMKVGKGYLRGADFLDRPMSVVNARLHFKADQPPETIHRFTLYTMECGRMVLPEGAETVIVIFDLSNFSLANMDWGFVRLFVQCFESYYPETLGVCVVHRAPFVFWGLWKMIQPLLDPVVSSKFVFTRNNEELHQVIPRERLPIKHYDGLDDWTYEYVPERPGENDLLLDVTERDHLLKERHALEARFDETTRQWIQAGKTSSAKEFSDERDLIAAQMRVQYIRLSKYTRAQNLYQRWGVAKDGKVNWTYNLKSEEVDSD